MKTHHKLKPVAEFCALEAAIYASACYGYDPKTETPAQARIANAIHLAHALQTARDQGCSFHWERDDQTNRSFTADGPEYWLYSVAMLASDGRSISSMGGIDLGEDGPGSTRNDSLRAYEAELAAEWLCDLDNAPEPEIDAHRLLSRGLECGVFDDAPEFKADVETYFEKSPRGIAL